MVANPMQRKARNSFLIGMIITLIVCVVIGGLLYFLLIEKNSVKGDKGELVTAYVLNQDVKSGDSITANSFKQIQIYDSIIPSNYINPEYIASMQGDYVAKVDMYTNTVVTVDTLSKKDQVTTADTRYVEYNMLVLPSTLSVGDYIDIRISFPNGQDLIVVSKKQIKSILGNTIGLELPEEDIVMMESAIVETYIMTSSKLYVIQYVEPGNQVASTKTYTPTTEVQGLIERNANIRNEAREELQRRFNQDIRTWINNSSNSYTAEEKRTNLDEGIQKEIENARAAREAYLSGLTSY